MWLPAPDRTTSNQTVSTAYGQPAPNRTVREPYPYHPPHSLPHLLLLSAAAEYTRGLSLAHAGILYALHATAWREGVWSSGVGLGETGGGGGWGVSAP